MSEQIKITTPSDKRTRYEELLSRIRSLVTGETDVIANLSNITSALKYGMNFFWVGFYLVKNNELVLGPFQGPVACTRIAEGKGVCGKAMQSGEPVIVPDVNLFPGHIACNSDSKSEIVLPAKKNGRVFLVLDVDSEFMNHFDETDKEYLGSIINLVEDFYK